MERSSPTILYVDDDEALVRLVQRGLSRRGYSVEGAATIEDGLARLGKGDIDVVALDHFLASGT
ncbi:MAG TPA: two-component system sensor histidine kinase/response regulator, partial [Roseiarcus sp.]|nr:two-component system sensor histidine kinase/response regulator [Roseiarcus sp.]